jgi:hypothetical protein
MTDTGAPNWSATGYGQYMAYKKYENIEFDESKAGVINVQFGIGSIPSGVRYSNIFHLVLVRLCQVADFTSISGYDGGRRGYWDCRSGSGCWDYRGDGSRF